MAFRQGSSFLVSVVVTTYSSPRVLDLVLASLERQNTDAYEVIVADDGSGRETRNLVQDWKSRFPVSLKHAWHPDEGFHLARIRNVGVKHADGDLLIFLDGDCIVGPNFVREPQRYCRSGWFTGVRCVLFGRSPTENLLKVTPRQWLAI